MRKICKSFQISSGPYKHHGKVISNSEKKGFNSQSKQFRYKQSENPGPGFYNVTHQSPEINSPSLSKKGTGYFPSLVPRTAHKKISSFPAANAYNILSYFQSRRDFSMGNSSVFQQPISRKTEKIPTPAPNQYHGTSAKKLKAGHYNINDSLTKVSPKGITSCFKSKTSHLTRTDRITAESTIYQPHKPTREAKKIPFKTTSHADMPSALPGSPFHKEHTQRACGASWASRWQVPPCALGHTSNPAADRAASPT
ncbi:O(6)-methylguanine-induced apoptosis 2 [Aix galericulata]|nr:O(6)-methylguanine-induced apoptosis 2 [Aix galericulata]